MNPPVTPSYVTQGVPTPKHLHQAGEQVVVESWYFTPEQIERCPSFIDGVPLVHIQEKKRKGVEFIRALAQELRLPWRTLATVIVFFLRFFQLQSFKRFSSIEVASTCLFLGAKVEDFTLPLGDCVLFCLYHKHNRERRFQKDSKEYKHLFDVISKLEMVVLMTLRFEFIIEHPYDSLLKICRHLKLSEALVTTMVQIAWNYVNDNLGTDLSLKCRPQMFAIAALYEASKECRCPLNLKEEFKLSDSDIPLVESIAKELLAVYGGQRPQVFQPAAGVLTPQPDPPAASTSHAAVAAPALSPPSQPATLEGTSPPFFDPTTESVPPSDSMPTGEVQAMEVAVEVTPLPQPAPLEGSSPPFVDPPPRRRSIGNLSEMMDTSSSPKPTTPNSTSSALDGRSGRSHSDRRHSLDRNSHSHNHHHHSHQRSNHSQSHNHGHSQSHPTSPGRHSAGSSGGRAESSKSLSQLRTSPYPKSWSSRDDGLHRSGSAGGQPRALTDDREEGEL